MRGLRTLFSAQRSEHWVRAGSVLIGIAAMTLLLLALVGSLVRNLLPSLLLMIVLVLFAVAIGLHIRFLLRAHREHNSTADTLVATEREYKSVFDHALDGILILDDRRICLDANPAAAKLFGTCCENLIGSPVDSFFSRNDDFVQAAEQFLQRTFAHGETCIRREDRRIAAVEYSVKSNFLPGRHVAVLRDITQRRQAERALRESEERFQQMAANIQELYWMVDADTLEVLYVNPAYEAITGQHCDSSLPSLRSLEKVIHAEDRARVLSHLKESAQSGRFDEEFRIVKPDKTSRWVWVRGFPVRDLAGIVRRLVGTAQDVTRRKMAEEQMARNLIAAEAARAEAEAFRQASLALTQDLSMDYVLDTLLRSLLDLVPCESGQVILVESKTRFFLAREAERTGANSRLPTSPSTLDAKESKFLIDAFVSPNGVLISDTRKQSDWPLFKGFEHLGSWLCVPLMASDRVLGFLSLGDTTIGILTAEHLRLAQSLAIPAAVAIQNARLYAQAEICRIELEQRLTDLQHSKDEAPRKGTVHLS